LPANNSLLKRQKGHTYYKMGCRIGTDIEECFICLCITVIKLFENELNIDTVWVYIKFAVL